MPEWNMNQEFKLKKIDKIRNYFSEEINQNELMSKKNKKFVEFWIILITRLLQFLQLLDVFQFLPFAFSVVSPIGIASSTIELTICVMVAGNKKYESIIKKKRKKHDQIALLAKSKLNNIKALISKALTDSCISHDEFVLINNALKEFYDKKEKRKNSNDK